jgi:hypothetical protein
VSPFFFGSLETWMTWSPASARKRIEASLRSPADDEKVTTRAGSLITTDASKNDDTEEGRLSATDDKPSDEEESTSIFAERATDDLDDDAITARLLDDPGENPPPSEDIALPGMSLLC